MKIFNEADYMVSEVLKTVKDKYVYLNLLLTEQCNFSCEHCMYDCSPQKPSLYMSDDILERMKKQIEFLNSLNIPIILNLIGGEPTLNFDKFEHIFKMTETWNTSLVMSSNGWWLDSPELVKRFFSLVSNKVKTSYGFDDEGIKNNRYFNVRLSDDVYHSKQAGRKNMETRLADALLAVGELELPPPTSKFPWIYTGEYEMRVMNYTWQTYPQGRGKESSDLNNYYKTNGITGSCCFADNIISQHIHYMPDGKISDTCGRGSLYEFGTIDDNIIFTMALILKYKADRYFSKKKYNCYNCREMVKTWGQNNLERIRGDFSHYNNFEESIFAEILKANP